jgi:hypothetical protein
MSPSALIPVFLRIVIAGVIDTTGFEEDSAADPADLNRKTVRSDDPKIHLRGTFVWIEVVQGDEGLSLVFIERFNLLDDEFVQPLVALHAFRYLDDRSLLENARSFRDIFACNEPFALSWHIL